MLKLGDVISENSALRPPKTLKSLPISTKVWEEAVGTRIAHRAEPIQLENGLLRVRVANSAWANELALLTDDIVHQLAVRGVPVASLRFVVGPMQTVQPTREPPRLAAHPDARVPKPLEAVLSKVDDDELRRAMTDAAAKSLNMLERE